MGIAVMSKLDLQISARDHVQGSNTAALTLLEYGDYDSLAVTPHSVKAVQRRSDDFRRRSHVCSCVPLARNELLKSLNVTTLSVIMMAFQQLRDSDVRQRLFQGNGSLEHVVRYHLNFGFQSI